MLTIYTVHSLLKCPPKWCSQARLPQHTHTRRRSAIKGAFQHKMKHSHFFLQSQHFFFFFIKSNVSKKISLLFCDLF